MQLMGKTAIVTGAASGIGAAVAKTFAKRGVTTIGLVDRVQPIDTFNALKGIPGVQASVFVGDVCDPNFRGAVFDKIETSSGNRVRIVVPAAGITRDGLAVKRDKKTGRVVEYDVSLLREVLDVNLEAPTYWAIEMARRIVSDGVQWSPADEVQAVAVFIGSISAQGNMGQLSYAASKAGLSAVAATLRTEWKKFGMQVKVVHPGFTDTPMVAKMPPDVLAKLVGQTQIGRLIKPEEIAAIVANVATDEIVSVDVWADGGYHGPA